MILDNGSQINTVAMKEKILDILEKHYHGRNFIESRCADELLGLLDVSERVWTVNEIIAILETHEDAEEHAKWFDKHGR